jgi:GGDEF domain-containing protein
MIKFLLAFFLVSSAWAKEPECSPFDNFQSVTALSSSIAAVSEKSICTKKALKEDNFLSIAAGCLTGGGKAIKGTVEGFIELVKLLVVDAPAWIYGEAREKILKIIEGDLNPMEMASAIASINMKSQENLWDKAQEYWESFKKFSSELKKSIVSEIKSFPCLPARKQSEIICKGVSEVFLLVLGPDKFIKGAKWGIETSKALRKFVVETKKMPGVGNMSVAARLNRASKALSESTEKGSELLKLRNSSLREVTLPDGEKILQYEQKIKGKDGKLHTVKREVPLDAKTHAIDSNSAIGKQILGDVIQANGGKGSLVFIDVNHLGKVNYYKKGTQGGDQYLASVAESIRKTLRPGDMVFKNGGDELVVVLGNNNPGVVKNISQRIMNEVDRNPKVREIFRKEVAGLSQKYRDVNKASSLSDMPAASKAGLSASELKLARENFPKFKDTKKKELMALMQEQATYKGSVSVGSTFVKSGEKIDTVLSRAEQQAARVKAEYKARMGQDISKYNIEIGSVTGPRKGPPVALDPL